MTYHNTLTRLKANFMTLKGTVGTSLMNLFKPVLVLVNNAIVVINRFAKAVGDSLGKILGWKYEVGSGAVALDDAADYAEDLEGGLGGAGKAAKDLKRQLQGFDELNNLTSNDPSGGGGGGGGGAGGVGAGGASDLAGRWVREESLFESEWDTWFKLGRGISEAWTDGLNSIPWDSVYEKAREFGKGFADFLNGLFTPELFGAVGKTIAGSLNTAIYGALAFGEELNWKQMGEAIASGINNFMSTYDFKATGQAIQTWSKGILDMLIEAVDKIEWADFGKSLTDFITSVDLPGIATKASTLASKLISGLSTAITNTDWSKVGEEIGKAIGNLKIPELAGKLAGLALDILEALGQAFVSLAKEDPLSAGILAVIGASKLSGIKATLSTAIGNALGATSGNGFAIDGSKWKMRIIGATILVSGFKMMLSDDTSLGGGLLSTASVGVGTLMITGNPYLAIAAATIAGSINMMKLDNATVEKYIAQQHSQPGGLYGDAPASKLGDTGGKKFDLNDYVKFDETMNDLVLDTGRASQELFQYGYTAQDVGMIIGKDNSDVTKSYRDRFKYITREQKQETNTTKSTADTQKKNTKEYTTYAQTQIQKMSEQNNKNFASGASTGLSITKNFGSTFTKETASYTGGASDYWENMSTDILGKNQNLVTNIVSSVGTTKNSFLTNYEAIRSGTTTKMDTMKNAIGTIMGTMQTDNNTKMSTIASTIKSATNGASTSAQTAFNSMKTNLGTNLSGMNTNTTTSTNSMLSTIQTWSKNAKTTVTNTRANATFGVNYEKVSAVQSAINTLKSHWTDKNAKFTVTASTNSSDISSFAGNVLDRLKRSFRSVGGMFARAAENLHLFATGGVAESATLGVFGEAGAEAIVPLERNTKWLGRMSNMLADELAYKNYTPTTYSAPKYTGSTSVVAQTSARSEQATAEQNALLREEVELLRQIAGKEFSVSSRDVFNSVQNESENYYNRTGNSPFIF